MARHRRRRHHSIALRNPFSVGALMSKPKEILNKDFAIEAVAAAGGFVLPGIVMAKFPPNLVNSTVKYYGVKVGTVILLSVGAGFISKRASRIVLIGGVASILLDVWAMWQAAHAAPAAAPAPKSGTQVYYGPNISPYYGGMSDVGGYADDDTGMTMEDAAGEGF